MRQIAARFIVVLACASAINCSGSDPASPSAPPPSGGSGSGGSGGSGGGGGTPTGQTAVYADDLFSDNDWDYVVQTTGSGGSGGAGQLHFNGQADAGYWQVTLSANNGATTVALFGIKRGIAYFPTTDGKIFTVAYSENSILQSGGGNGQYSGPAVKQNGNYYAVMPGGRAFATPDATWTPHSLSGLTQDDFRTLGSAAEHPDFSSTGARMEVGFVRVVTLPASGTGGTWKGGIDNWRLTLNR